MKKLVLTIAVVLGLGFGAMAQNSLFGYAFDEENSARAENESPLLPSHGQTTNQPATPLAGGTLLLAGLGAAYAISKRKK